MRDNHMQLSATVRGRWSNQAGMTIAEVLLSGTLTLLVLASAATFNRFQLFALRNQASQVDLQTTARSVVDLFAREVRRAGRNPGCAIAAFSGIASASSTAVRIQSDLNGDGAITGANEDITYSYDPSSNTVQRIDNNTSSNTATLISGVTLTGSTIRYFNDTGTELSNGTSGLTAAQRSAVRRIRLQLALASSAVDPTNSQTLKAQAATDVDLRNRYFLNTTACAGS